MAIPATAHWVWFGEDMPGWAGTNVERFRDLHPGWTIRVWRELPGDFPRELRAIVDALPWYSSRSDIFRYWLLSEHGGVYCDTDIVALRLFDRFLNHSFFLAPSLPEGHTKPHLNCALMGSEPQSRAILAVLDECVRFAAEDAPPKRIAYGPDLLTRILADGSSGATILPLHYFYSIPDRSTAHRFWKGTADERERILNAFRTTFTDDEEPFAVHLWGVDGSSQRRVMDQ